MQVQKYREALREEHGLDYAEACAFIPTGWAAVSTYNVKNSRQTKGGASCLPTLDCARCDAYSCMRDAPPHARTRTSSTTTAVHGATGRHKFAALLRGW